MAGCHEEGFLKGAGVATLSGPHFRLEETVVSDGYITSATSVLNVHFMGELDGV